MIGEFSDGVCGVCGRDDAADVVRSKGNSGRINVVL